MSEYKSLEHTIRNIAEGQKVSENTDISLEHTIRNIAEGIGIIGDDKPKGTPKAFMTRTYKSQNGGHVSAGKGSHANMKQADHIKMESGPSDMSDVTLGTMSTEDGKKKKEVKEVSDVGADSTPVSTWPTSEDGKKVKKECCGTMGGQGNEVGDMGRNFKIESGKKKMKEEAEHIEEKNVYHVSWGPGLDHEVTAMHGDEAVSKAKDALISKTPKLKDPKYSDTFNKKPMVHNISNERKMQKEETGPGSVGTVERVKIKNVARFKDFGPKSSKSTLAKTGEILKKVIDEADEKLSDKSITDDDGKEKPKLTKGKTQVEFEPKLKMPSPDDFKAEETIEEGKVRDMAKVASVVGALGAHAGKVYDVGNVATHQDPAHAVTTALTYANPTSRALNMLPTAFKADKVNKDEDEKARQKKYGTKLVTKEEKEMSEDNTNPLIAAFFELQNKTSDNMFEAAKALSPKQKKIAAVAGDKEKIDAADFAALRAGKKVEEEVEEIDETKKPEVSVYDGAAHVKDATGKVVASYSKKEHGSDYMKKANAHVAKEDVEFSAEELAHFDSVLEALGQSKDAAQKGSFKKAGTNPNGDPVRPTVPDRDLTDDVQHVQETSSEKKADYVDKATSAIVNKEVVGRSANKHALRIQKIKRHDPFIDWKKTDSSVKEETEKKEYKKLSYDEFVKGRIENPTAEQHKEIGRRLKKAGVPGSGWHFKKAKEMQKNVKEETIDEARGRPKKVEDDAPQHSGRDPRQHIQVIAGQAAAGRVIDFKHNNGKTSKITPGMGRTIVAHLNSLKPADRQATVNKMHDSPEGFKH